MIVVYSLVASILALVFAYTLAKKIFAQDTGNEKMREIADAIHKGSMAFLHREYRTLVVFAVGVAVILLFLLNVLYFYFYFGIH